ncbi:hypothetical protein [Rhizobium leguminosarum]|uniref:hypothetical protein n=1 Tax=Rhizobium leguminosarum TaxID=384 RepID=UPI001C9597D7|nr:hypothetical protein [Rhizobium leguminosarum]MBY5422321.1 hypothetical protein [Rhizobium leguminosarum]
MAILPESYKAFRYQTGIDRICEAYRASADTINKALAEATQAYAQYVQAGVDDSEYDEDGVLLSSSAHSLAQAELDSILAGGLCGRRLSRALFITGSDPRKHGRTFMDSNISFRR